MRVQQAVSLYKAYQSHEVAPDREVHSNRVYKVRSDGTSRIDRAKTSWYRFTSRQSHRLSRVADCFCSQSRSTSREVDRFNLRHEKFSAKVQNLVGDLREGRTQRLENPDYVASLRHDVKLMHQDMPWASRQTLLESRLDVELSKLSNDQLASLKSDLCELDVSRHDARNLRDLEVFKTSVLRQEWSRSPEMAACFQVLQDGSTAKTWPEIQSAIQKLEARISSQASELGLRLKISEGAALLRGATVLALQHPETSLSPTQIGRINQQYLTRRDQNWLETFNPPPPDHCQRHASEMERGFARGLRDAYLISKVPPLYQDEHLQTHFTRIGKGAAHLVHRGEYQESGTPTPAITKVHKEDDETILRDGRYFCAPQLTGMDHFDPRLLERAVFTSRMNEFLELDVCVKTDFALHHDRPGLVMDLAEGTTAALMRGRVEMNEGRVMCDFAALQLLDAVTGQMDRHQNNYMIRLNDQKEYQGLSAIDSDFCMGLGIKLPQDFCRESVLHYRGYPPVIDTQMLERLQNLDAAKIHELADQMFGEVELEALQTRVSELLSLVASGKIQVIAPTAWGDAATRTVLEGNLEASKRPDLVDRNQELPLLSYWARDKDSLQHRDLLNELFG